MSRLEEFGHARDRARLRKGIAVQAASGVRYENGMFVVQNDASTTPFDRPFDLGGSSIYFNRTGAGSFDVSKTALVYEASIGPNVHSFSSYGSYTQALPFSFPFYSGSYSNLHISSSRGIYFSAPSDGEFYQYGGLESVAARVPVISPLLITSSGGSIRDLWVTTTATTATITWKRPLTGEDIQVTLFNDGDIQFSYAGVPDPVFGSIVVTDGNESFYGLSSSLGSVADASLEERQVWHPWENLILRKPVLRTAELSHTQQVFIRPASSFHQFS